MKKENCNCTGARLIAMGISFIHAKGCPSRKYGIVNPKKNYERIQNMKEELADGWEDCMAMMKRRFHDQLDEESKSHQRWGHEPVLSIESFRRIVDTILKV